MECEATRDRIPDRVSSNLSEPDRQTVSDHLSRCSECGLEMKAYERLAALLESTPEVDPSVRSHSPFGRTSARLGLWLTALAATAIFGSTLWLIGFRRDPARPENPQPSPADVKRDPAPQEQPPSKVTVTCRDENVRTVLSTIAREGKANLVVSPDVKGTITAEIKEVPWPDAMSAVAKTAGFIPVHGRSNIVRVVDPQMLVLEKQWEKTLTEWLVPPAGKGEPKVTFDQSDADIKDLLAALVNASVQSVVVSPEVKGLVAQITVREVGWTDALDAVVRTLGFAAVRDASGIIRVAHPESLLKERAWREKLKDVGIQGAPSPRADFTFKDADVREVLKMIGRIEGINLVYSPDVKGTITASVKNLPALDALDAVVRTLGYAALREKPGVIRVVHPDELLRERAPGKEEK